MPAMTTPCAKCGATIPHNGPVRLDGDAPVYRLCRRCLNETIAATLDVDFHEQEFAPVFWQVIVGDGRHIRSNPGWPHDITIHWR